MQKGKHLSLPSHCTPPFNRPLGSTSSDPDPKVSAGRLQGGPRSDSDHDPRALCLMIQLGCQAELNPCMNLKTHPKQRHEQLREDRTWSGVRLQTMPLASPLKMVAWPPGPTTP